MIMSFFIIDVLLFAKCDYFVGAWGSPFEMWNRTLHIRYYYYTP